MNVPASFNNIRALRMLIEELYDEDSPEFKRVYEYAKAFTFNFILTNLSKSDRLDFYQLLMDEKTSEAKIESFLKSHLENYEKNLRLKFTESLADIVPKL